MAFIIHSAEASLLENQALWTGRSKAAFLPGREVSWMEQVASTEMADLSFVKNLNKLMEATSKMGKELRFEWKEALNTARIEVAAFGGREPFHRDRLWQLLPFEAGRGDVQGEDELLFI